MSILFFSYSYFNSSSDFIVLSSFKYSLYSIFIDPGIEPLLNLFISLVSIIAQSFPFESFVDFHYETYITSFVLTTLP